MSPPWIERVVQKVEPTAGLAECGFDEGLAASLQRIADRLTAVSTGGKAHADVTAIFDGGHPSARMKGATALAKETGVDLYRIDMSLVVSDEVIQTEKTLRRILDAAEKAGGVLYFDETDVLLKDATDEDPYPERGAGYLMKQMGRYEGLSIISVEDKSKMDPAITRRLRYAVSFN